MQVIFGIAAGLGAGLLACLAVDRLLKGYGDEGPFASTEDRPPRDAWVAAAVAIAAMALLGAAVARAQGAWATTLIAVLGAGTCWAVSVIDLRVRRIPNALVGALAGLALAQTLALQRPTPPSALLGGLVGGGVFALLYLLGRGAMGAGDVKFMAAGGLLLGYEGIPLGMLWGILLGGLAALVLLITRRAGRKDAMAYGPYLALGVWAYWIAQHVLS